MTVTPLPTTLAAVKNMLSYSRESSERLIGVYGQDAEILEWAEREGYEIVGQFRDVGVHGQAPVEERIGLRAAVQAIECGAADGVIVHRLDRLSRDFPTQDDVMRRIWKAGGRVFSTEPSQEWREDRPGDPSWRLRRDYARMAEDELHALLSRLQGGRRRKQARGGYTGGHRFRRRYGVELVEIQGKLEYRPVPSEQAVIKRIVAACPDGAGYYRMSKVLNAEGVPTVAGGKWTTKVVRDLALRGPDRPLVVEAVAEVPAIEWRRRAVV